MAEQKYKWVDPSKQLPKEYTYVLCWYEYFRYGDYNKMQKNLWNWILWQWLLERRCMWA